MAGQLRDEMPGAAALVDELRAAFGQAWVDAALREGLRLQREHQRRARSEGGASADAWLALQGARLPALALTQADRQVGCLPGNQAAAWATSHRRRPA